jgi:hypothetical protein
VRRSIVFALGLVALVAMLAYLNHHGNPPGGSADKSGAADSASTEAAPPKAEVSPPTSETQILAECHPHLSPNTTSVPNIDVSERRNPAGVRLKVRFWVNGDGFVTQAFSTGASVYTAWEQEDALHYIKGLTFSVLNTADCRARRMELIGNFFETRGSAGDWATAVELHPLYSLEGTRVVPHP